MWVFVHFVLLDWLIYEEYRFMGSQFGRLKSKIKVQTLEGLLLPLSMAEGIIYRARASM